MPAYALKVALQDARAARWRLVAQKTMYGGKAVTAGDVVFVFDSENRGGSGLVARALVEAAEPDDPLPGVARQTPRVTLTLRRTATAAQALGRATLRGFDQWGDGRPETELNFKLYRQATDKLVGLTAATSAWLEQQCLPSLP